MNCAQNVNHMNECTLYKWHMCMKQTGLRIYEHHLYTIILHHYDKYRKNYAHTVPTDLLMCKMYLSATMWFCMQLRTRFKYVCDWKTTQAIWVTNNLSAWSAYYRTTKDCVETSSIIMFFCQTYKQWHFFAVFSY